jgi:hypothetical protein
MTNIKTLRHELRNFATQEVCVPAIVKAVQEEKATCTVSLAQNAKIEMPDVRLQALPLQGNAIGLLIIPKIGSSVNLLKIDNMPFYTIVAYTQIEKLILYINETKVVEIEADKIELFGGQLGYLVDLNKLLQRLNSIEQAFNSLLNYVSGHTHPHPQGNTSAPAPGPSQGQLNITQEQDVKNPKIKQ